VIYLKQILEIPDELRNKLEERAEKLGTSMSYIIKDALDRYLNE